MLNSLLDYVRKGITKAPPPGMCLWDVTLWQSSVISTTYTVRQCGAVGRFSPLVFSSDGLGSEYVEEGVSMDSLF